MKPLIDKYFQGKNINEQILSVGGSSDEESIIVSETTGKDGTETTNHQHHFLCFLKQNQL